MIIRRLRDRPPALSVRAATVSRVTTEELTSPTDLRLPPLPASWQPVLGAEIAKPYYAKLDEFVAAERAEHQVFPPQEDIFAALQATAYQDGKVVRTFPIDTGQTTRETFVTYTGTMAVLGKGNPVEMKGNYGGGDVYDDFVNWATQITWSGTYVHAAPWDPDIGSANDDSHGCVHCRTEDAEWYYGIVTDGDVVTINGSLARTVAVDNGICTFTLDWPTLLKGSAYGPTLNGKPTSA